MKTGQSVMKSLHIKFRCWGIAQKTEYSNRFFIITILYSLYTELQLCLLFYGCETWLSHIREGTYIRMGCSERHWPLILHDNYHLSPTVTTVPIMWVVSQVIYINMINVQNVETYSCQFIELNNTGFRLAHQ
jgi:hypothetical protein